MTDEQMKELSDLRVALQDLKYQLTRKHDLRELTDEEIEEVARPYCDLQNWVVDKHEFARAILKKAGEK